MFIDGRWSMLTGNKSSTKNKRMLFALVSLALLCAVIAVGFAKEISQRFDGSADIPVRNEGAARNPERTDAHMSDKLKFVEPLPQSGAQFDLSRNVIAGGGGTSTTGNFKVDGTVGQPAAGTSLSNGQFSQAGGFWQPDSAATASPSPSPSPSPSASPSPTPQAPFIFIEEGTINRAAALDSVTHVRGPFRIITNHNFSADKHTRVILFTSNLGLSQPDSSILSAQAAGFPLTVENVGTLLGVPGLDASFIVVSLPDGLPPGDLPLTVTLRGVVSSNAPTLGISP